MKVTKQKLKINTSGFSFKIKNKEGNRRMKMYIKMNKNESEQWNTVKDAVLGGSKTDEAQFAKFIFFKGLGSFMDEVSQSVDKLSEEEKSAILDEHKEKIESVQDTSIDIEVSKVETEESDEDGNEAN